MRKYLLAIAAIALLFACSKEKEQITPSNPENISGNLKATSAIISMGTVTDVDGNVYNTIAIGNQTWMVENLRTTKYADGTPIAAGTYYWYNNDAATYKNTYGALYNWSVVSNSQKLAPTGWHVASRAEWTQLKNYLGGSNVAGGKMKEDGYAHWASPNTSATNSSGFTGLPGGYNNGTNISDFAGINTSGYWWTSTSNNSTEAWASGLDYNWAGSGEGPYSKDMCFSVRCVKNITPPNPTVTDVDGNVYNTIVIGNQTWMVENLRTTKYADGTPITAGTYYWYNNDPASYKNTYGALYNWSVVSNSKKIAPAGWHVASRAEWTQLKNYLGGKNVAGGKMKEAGYSHWSSPNTDATNSSGFTGLPGGYNNGTNISDFGGMNVWGYWWTSTSNNTTEAWASGLDYDGAMSGEGPYSKDMCFAVRCVKDGPAPTFNIGQSYQGGKIFYIDNSGVHGLVAATFDLHRTYKWYDGAPENIGAIFTGIYGGLSNTLRIIDKPGNSAAKLCWDLANAPNMYYNWYLPSKDELNLLWARRNSVGGFAEAWYWSSTEDFANNAWCQRFMADGTQSSVYKTMPYCVRAIHTF